MSNTNILAIEEVAEGQNNTYITVNNAFTALEEATNARYANAAVGAGPINISEADGVAYVLYKFSGATGDFDVNFPDEIDTNPTQRLAVFQNADTTHTMTVSAGGVSYVDVAPLAGALCHIYGDTIVLLAQADTGVPTFPYDFGAFIPGQPSDGGTVAAFLIPRAISLADDFAGSYGNVSVNPTLTATFSVAKNGTAVGTFQISTLGVFSFVTTGLGVTINAGDRITVTAPSPQDATLTNVSFVFAGTRIG